MKGNVADEVEVALIRCQSVGQHMSEWTCETSQAGEFERANHVVDRRLVAPQSHQPVERRRSVVAGQADKARRRTGDTELQAAAMAERWSQSPDPAAAADTKAEARETVGSQIVTAEAGRWKQLLQQQSPDVRPNAVWW